jgi:hypothetical protein
MKLIKINFNEDNATEEQLNVIKQYNETFDMLLNLQHKYAKEYYPAGNVASRHNPIKDLASLESWGRRNKIAPANYMSGVTSRTLFEENIQKNVAAIFEAKAGLLDNELISISRDLIDITVCALYRSARMQGIRPFILSADMYQLPTDLKYIIFASNATGLKRQYIVVDGISVDESMKRYVLSSDEMKEVFHITETTENTFYADPIKKCIESDQDYLQPYLILKLNRKEDYIVYDEIRYVEQCYSTIMYGPSYLGDDEHATNENCHCKMDIPCLHGPASVAAEITCGDEMHPFWVPTDKKNYDTIKMPAGYGIASVQIKEYYIRGHVDEVKFTLQDNFDDTYTLIYTPTRSNVEITIVAIPLLDAKIGYVPDGEECGLAWVPEDGPDWISGELCNAYAGRRAWGIMMYYQAPILLPEGSEADYITKINNDLIDIYRGDYDLTTNTFTWKSLSDTDAVVTSIAMNPAFVSFESTVLNGVDGFVYFVRIKAGGIILVNTTTGRKYKCVSRQLYIATPPTDSPYDYRYACILSRNELDNHTDWFIKKPEKVININSTACKCDEVAFDVFDTKSVSVTPINSKDNTIGFRVTTKMDLRHIKEYNPGRISALMYDASGRCIPATIYCINTEENYVEIRIVMKDEIKNRGLTIIFPRGMVMDTSNHKTYISNEYILQMEYHDNNLVTDSFKEVGCDCGCCDDKKNDTRYNIDLTKFDGRYGAKLCAGTVNTWKFACAMVIHGYEHREFCIGSIVPGDFRIIGRNGTVVGKCTKVLDYRIAPPSNFVSLYADGDRRVIQVLQFELEVTLNSNSLDETPLTVYFDLGTIPGKGVSKMLISDATKPSGWTEIQPQTIAFKPREWRNR